MTYDDVDLLEQLIILRARESFPFYRLYMTPADYKTGWFQNEVCMHLQSWYESFKAGERPILIINTPPQHGKSDIIASFITWLIGKEHNCKFIFASFSEQLSMRANRNVQRIMESERFKKIFPDVHLPSSGSKNFTRTRSLLEFMDNDGQPYRGTFRNTTVQGAITGESLDIGIIDDPIKGREEANSRITRDNTWAWFTDDFLTRFSDGAGMICIATRWHIDDPIGRLIAKYPSAKVVKYEAIATHDEPHRKAGEALFPEHKSLEFLLNQKKMAGTESWESLYQQNPVITGGNLIKIDNFKRHKVLPKLKFMRMFVDTAAKIKQRNDYTVFGVYGLGEDNLLYIIEIVRGKWEFTPMKQKAKDLWFKYLSKDLSGIDAPLRDMVVESKSSGIQLIQDLKREAIIPVTEIERMQDKRNRLMNVIGYIESGYVSIPEPGHRAPWVNDFLAECEVFTGLGDTHDDQVDTFIDALQFMISDRAANLLIWEQLN